MLMETILLIIRTSDYGSKRRSKPRAAAASSIVQLAGTPADSQSADQEPKKQR